VTDEILRRLDAEIRRGTFGTITSIVVAQGGRIVHEAYFEGGAQTLRNTRSATKTVAGMLVGLAIEHGDISGVDAPLLSFFADRAPFAHDGPAKRAVTLEDLLTMSSALDCDDGDPASPGNEELMYETPDWLRFALDLPMRSPPDRGTWRYCTAGVTALAGVLERATGHPVEEFARLHLFAPLGVDDATWFRSPTGLVQTGGGLEMRSRDLLALGQLALDEGTHAGHRILAAAWVRASLQPHRRIDDVTDYGYLWWLRTLPLGASTTRVALMQGNGGNKVVVLPELEAVAVITSTNFDTPGMHAWTDAILVDHLLPLLAHMTQAASPANPPR
jgi:CubicO group peptidase (beta-lactamase class C family)